MEPAVVMIAARFGAALFGVLVVQTTLVADLPILDVRADLILLMAIAAGIAFGPERGAMVGFAAGLAFDLLVSTPFGLSALAFCLVGHGVGLLHGTVLRSAWWIPVLTAMGASAAGVVAYAVLGEVLGQDGFVSGSLPRIAGVIALVNGALIFPMLRVVRWALPVDTRLRVAVR